MIKLIVHKGVHCFGLPQSLMKKVKQELTFANPAYTAAKKNGRWIPPDEPEYLSYYAEKDGIIYIPRGYLWNLKRTLKKANIEHKMEDRTLRFDPIKFEFKGVLRDYQAKANKDITRYPIGVLEASTGSGKTIMALKMIQQRGQPTLILVHTKELLYQWQERIKEFMNFDCGMIGDGKFSIKDITVGTIQTVNNRLAELQPAFGHLIVDECHRCPAKVWSQTLVSFPAKYYLGLSATTYRRDNLTAAIFVHIGPKIHEVDSKLLQKTGAVLTPEIRRVKTRFSYFFRNDYSSLITALTKDEQRNKLIVNAILYDIKQNNNPILVVSDRKGHCTTIQKLLEEKGHTSHVLTSGVSSKKRKEIVSDLRDGTCKILISTLSLIGEGFDAPNLHALFLITPVKFIGRVVQIIGRVLRPEKNKHPRVYDFRDTMVKPLLYSGFARDRVYKSEWS